MALIFAILYLFYVATLAKDYYKILELEPDATENEIKRNFRKLSLKYHPDKNPGDEVAHQKFVDVNEAHDILSKEDKRQIYDLEGLEGLERDKKGAGGMGNIFDLFTGQLYLMLKEMYYVKNVVEQVRKKVQQNNVQSVKDKGM